MDQKWISKGKLGTPVELGQRMPITSTSTSTSTKHGIIIDYKIMENTTDMGQVAPLLERLETTLGLDTISSLRLTELNINPDLLVPFDFFFVTFCFEYFNIQN